MTVTYQIPSPHVALITLNRPDALNAISFEMTGALSAAVDRAAADPDLRALILTGAGPRAFCAGGDLYELAGRTSEADGLEVSFRMTDVLRRLEMLPVPTLASVNGLARGGGAEIALACDLRYLAENASIGFTQIRLAVTPGWGGGQRLLRTVGYARALEWLLAGRVLTAEYALAAGLVQRVLPAAELLPAAVEWSMEIAAHPPEVVRGIKQVLRAGLALPPEEAAAAEHAVFPPLWAGSAHQEAVGRFLNRPRDDAG